MPWSQTSPMDQRTQFIADYLRDSLSITELCQLYNVSRKTGYKWIGRYLRSGPAGLQERSRKPQRKFNAFKEEFNDERPHEALDMQTPACCYQPSAREMPNKIPPLEYPDRFEVRYVSANGGIRWKRDWINVSIVCVGEYVGLEEIDDGIWNVYFGPLKLGRLNERHMKIEDEYGRLNRKIV